MASAESQEFSVLHDDFYNDPSQLSQLLRRRGAGGGNPVQFTPSIDHHHSSADAFTAGEPPTRDAPPLQSPVAAHRGDDPPRDPTSRHARFHPRHVKPSLPKHHTAPTSTGFVMERDGGEKVHQSFGDAMDAPGDTQPDSQIYKDFTSGLLGSASNRGPSPTSLFNPVEDADTPTDGVDIADSSPEQHSQAITSPTVIQDDDPETQLRVDPLTSPLKFETPATVGRKRDSQGQVLSSAMRTATTPGTFMSASAFFGAGVGNGGIENAMSLTQAFNATQAGTSPAVDAPSEDPVFQRPSPNFTNARNSSPVQAMSSPIKAARTDPPLRSSSEPRAAYVTMKESQEQRQRELTNEDTTAVAQDSWDEPTEAEKRVAQRRAREEFENKAGKSLKQVSAPALSPPRRGKRRGLLSVMPKYQTPSALRLSRWATYDGPNESEEEGEATPVHENRSDDSLDELSQGIPSSAPPARTSASTVKRRNTEHKVQVPNTSSHPNRTLSGRSARKSSSLGSPSLQPQRESQLRAPGSQPACLGPPLFKSSKESVTIMDSQPDVTGDFDTIPRPRSLLIPSSPSIGQYSIDQTTIARHTGFTSQVVSSSMPPMPPRSSSQVVGDALDEEQPQENERVPSSPPVIAHEEDVVYDEHAYDEHFTGEGEEDLGLEHSINGDIDMDAENHIPESDHSGGEEEEMELGEPTNMATGNDEGHEVPETEQDDLPESHEDELLHSSSHPEVDYGNPVPGRVEMPRLQRQSTIPESDMLEDTQPSIFRQTKVTGNDDDSHADESAAQESAVPDQTNSTAPFHTSQEDHSAPYSNKSSVEAPKHEEALNAEQATGIRSLNDIANQPDTQQSSNIGDIEIPQLSFAEEMDDDLNATMSGSSPPRPPKKRKITYSSKKKNFMSPIKDSDPLPDRVPSSPLKQVQEVREDTPPSASVEKRGKQGALAASNAREEAFFAKPATLKLSTIRKPTNPRTQRKGALKPVNKSLFRRSTSKSPAKSNPPMVSVTSVSPLASSKGVMTKEVDLELPDADASIDAVDDIVGSTPQHIETNGSNHGEAPKGELLVPNRVFAYWPGQIIFYPATCIGRADARHLQVRYDDGNLHSLETVQVRAFDLRIGDQVKVDQAGMKKCSYIVVGFKDKIDGSDGEKYPLTDRRGYATVLLEEKQRDSLPTAQAEPRKPPISVPMSKLYLTNGLWVKFRDRMYNFTPPSSPSASASRVATPDATNGPATPSTSRRGTAGLSLKESIKRTGSVASSIRTSGTVFFNMAFAITFTQDSSDKDAITRLITSNGGQVLEDGFHELFDDFESDASSTPKGKGKITTSGGADELVMKEEFQNLGFVALISDSHSRRSKYIQALALNIPCLHLRWIRDSISLSRPMPFVKYLLPAGISTYLDPEGVVRSRTMGLYDPGTGDLKFDNMVRERELLLSGQSVLLVIGKGKKDLERKKPYLFLTHALGPNVVGRCTDLETAKSMIKNGVWDWVYVDGGERGVADAEGMLFGNGKAAGGKTVAKSKKRKRDESVESEAMVKTGSVGDKRIRVTCDEFVIQSLILGALVEE